MSLKMSYDKKYDILYARYPNSGHSYGEEDNNGIVVFHNIDNDDITGLAIYSIKDKLLHERINLGLLPIPLNSYALKIQELITQ